MMVSDSSSVSSISDENDKSSSVNAPPANTFPETIHEFQPNTYKPYSDAVSIKITQLSITHRPHVHLQRIYH